MVGDETERGAPMLDDKQRAELKHRYLNEGWRTSDFVDAARAPMAKLHVGIQKHKTDSFVVTVNRMKDSVITSMVQETIENCRTLEEAKSASWTIFEPILIHELESVPPAKSELFPS
jgi:hypothetical protein